MGRELSGFFFGLMGFHFLIILIFNLTFWRLCSLSSWETLFWIVVKYFVKFLDFDNLGWILEISGVLQELVGIY
jgi:hypothetical protein